MSLFSYKFTCPDINQAQEEFQQNLRDYLSDLISDVCPLLEGDIKKVIDDYTNYIYDDVNKCFEDVRSCNSDIRDEAEKQIKEITNKRNN